MTLKPWQACVSCGRPVRIIAAGYVCEGCHEYASLCRCPSVKQAGGKQDV